MESSCAGRVCSCADVLSMRMRSKPLVMAAEKPGVRNAMDSCRDMLLHAPPGVAMLEPNTSSASWSTRKPRQLRHFVWIDPNTTKVSVNQCHGLAKTVLASSVQSPASEGKKETISQAPGGPAALCWLVCPGLEQYVYLRH